MIPPRKAACGSYLAPCAGKLNIKQLVAEHGSEQPLDAVPWPKLAM